MSNRVEVRSPLSLVLGGSVLSKIDFQARLWVSCTDGLQSVEEWVYELYPHIDDKARPATDWVHEYLHECYSHYHDVLALTNLPKDTEKNLQVLIKGVLRGWGPDHNGEYDEEMEVLECKWQDLPDNYFDIINGVP